MNLSTCINAKSLIKIRLFADFLTGTNYFARSATADADSVVVTVVDMAESVAIVVVSVDIVVVIESVVVAVSSVLGLLWQAANVSVLPINRRARTFFICYGR